MCTKYAYGQEYKNGESCKFIPKIISKIYGMYGNVDLDKDVILVMI